MDTPASQPSGKELLKEFLSLPLEHCTRTLTRPKLMAIFMYLNSKPKDDEYYAYMRKSEAGLTWSRGYKNTITAKIYKAADLNMDANYRPIYRSDSVKNDNFVLANLSPHQDYGVTYTRVGVTRPDNGIENILELYEEKGYDGAFIAWTDPELVKVVALMLMCGMHRTEVAAKVNRSYNSVRDIEHQLMVIGYMKGLVNGISYNYIGHFLQKLIDITKFDRSKDVTWNYINATFPVKQPDLYFPYAGYRYSDADPKLKPLFRGVEGFSYAFYRCKNSKTGRTYTDRADNWNLFFCPQSNIMHYDMDMYIDLMAQVVKPHHRLKHPFIEAILGTFMTGKIETILENYDENLYQIPGNIVAYILALMNRFPDRIKPIDPRKELSVTTPLTREKWLTDPRLKYLLVYQYFLMEVIRGRPVFQPIRSRGPDDAYNEELIIAARTRSAAQLNHTPKYDPYKFHADRSDEETLEEVGDKVQRNKGGRTVVKLFNGVWEEEIIKNTIWDVCTKHSLIEFNNKMYRSRVDAHRNIQNKSYIRPGMTHRPNYLDWPIALKDILPLIGIHRRRTHNIFNYVLKYHIKKHKISPFKTNYCQIEERKDKIVLTAGLNRLNLTHLQWIDILEYLRIHAFIGDFSYINNDRLSILSSNQLSVDNAEDDTDE